MGDYKHILFLLFYRTYVSLSLLSQFLSISQGLLAIRMAFVSFHRNLIVFPKIIVCGYQQTWHQTGFVDVQLHLTLSSFVFNLLKVLFEEQKTKFFRILTLFVLCMCCLIVCFTPPPPNSKMSLILQFVCVLSPTPLPTHRGHFPIPTIPPGIGQRAQVNFMFCPPCLLFVLFAAAALLFLYYFFWAPHLSLN